MSDSDERYTPRQELYDPLNRVFRFDLDPCTTQDNPLDTYNYFTKEHDGLAQSWGKLSVFVNPPYSQMRAWAVKAVQAAADGAFVAFLIPSDPSTEAFQVLRGAAWGRWEPPFRVKCGTPDGRVVDVARGHVVFFIGGLP